MPSSSDKTAVNANVSWSCLDRDENDSGVTRWGVTVARRAWITPADVLNTLPVGDFKAALRRNRIRIAR